MATYTTIAVCNHALVLCGASPITSLTEDSTNARALNSIFTIEKENFLTECKWSFATTRTTLATVSTTTIAWFHSIDGEAFVYSKPSSALRIWEVSDEHAVCREEGDYIISDTASLGIKWTFDVDIGKFTSSAIVAFIDKLCSVISFIIMNDAKKSESFLTKYQKISLPDATSKNSQFGVQQILTDDAWEAAKFSNGGNSARSYS